MVRAGVVSHPRDWLWCSYSDLRRGRQRHRILNATAMVRAVGVESLCSFLEYQDEYINEAIMAGGLIREAHWTEGVVVGGEKFAGEVAARTTSRQGLQIEPLAIATQNATWIVREEGVAYDFLHSKNSL